MRLVPIRRSVLSWPKCSAKPCLLIPSSCLYYFLPQLSFGGTSTSTNSYLLGKISNTQRCCGSSRVILQDRPHALWPSPPQCIFLPAPVSIALLSASMRIDHFDSACRQGRIIFGLMHLVYFTWHSIPPSWSMVLQVKGFYFVFVVVLLCLGLV